MTLERKKPIERKERFTYLNFLNQKSIATLHPLEDFELIILKGHLIIEHSLNSSIKIVLREDDISQLDLNFYRKLLLGSYLNCIPNHPESSHISEDNTFDYFGFIKMLNSVRNKLAHSLDPIDEKIEPLFEFHKGLGKDSLSKIKYKNSIDKKQWMLKDMITSTAYWILLIQFHENN